MEIVYEKFYPEKFICLCAFVIGCIGKCPQAEEKTQKCHHETATRKRSHAIKSIHQIKNQAVNSKKQETAKAD